MTDALIAIDKAIESIDHVLETAKEIAEMVMDDDQERRITVPRRVFLEFLGALQNMFPAEPSQSDMRNPPYQSMLHTTDLGRTIKRLLEAIEEENA